jgi:eukaryotic-like serine/threonine-protein kinase
MDPPSPQLVRRLTAAGLCRPADLRRCRARVRRLARDVPAFESVWLDALVQARRLTAFQAEVLESDDPGRLSVGPFVLVDRAVDDGRFLHFRARRTDSPAPYLLSRLRVESDSPHAGQARLQAFLDRTAALAHPGLALPRGFEQVDGRMWIASPWTDGTSLRNLLVRRGRFAPQYVTAIAVQLCDALAAFEDVNVLHGDLRLRNVFLNSRGRTVLIAGGLRAALFHEHTIHIEVPPDDCDGIAPELIGSGRSAAVASDVFALGCLLWELLAGRPPFPHGDPLARLAAYQKQRIPDIRDWAPDTPPVIAELIHNMTDPVADNRPPSFRVLQSQLLRVRPASSRQLRQLMQAPVAALPGGETEQEPKRAANVIAAGVVVLAACSLLLLHSGTRAELLSIARKPAVTGETTKPAPTTADKPTVRSAETLPALPQPDASGVLHLHGPGPYAARDLSFTGKLEIRGAGTRMPVVICRDGPLRLTAEQLIFENVEVRRDPRSSAVDGDKPGALLQIQAQQFAVRHCRFEGRVEDQGPAIEWSLLDSESAGQRDCLVIDSVFEGSQTALLVKGPPATISLDNVLSHGSGPLIELSASDRGRRAIDIETRRVTIRGSSPLILCGVVDGARTFSPLKLSLEESVFELQQAALLEFRGADAPADWQRTLEITGEGSVIPPGALIAGVRVAPDRLRPLRADDVAIDGLMSVNLRFAGPAAGQPANSALVEYSGFGRSPQPPGIDAARLPPPRPTAYNSTNGAAPRDSSASNRPAKP